MNDLFGHRATRSSARTATCANSGNGTKHNQAKKYFFHPYQIGVKKPVPAKLGFAMLIHRIQNVKKTDLLQFEYVHF
jgi:hypothetical protein